MTMPRVLVVSPGVLPLPPVLGGAVENMIARLHAGVSRAFAMEYVSVALPRHRLQNVTPIDAPVHYIDSIDPLADFTSDNQFELSQSDRWPDYRDFVVDVARARRPDLVHVHNEARLLPALREAAPDARLLLHINDEVVTRMASSEVRELAPSCDLILACSRHIARAVRATFDASGVRPPRIDIAYNFVDRREYDPTRVAAADVESLRHSLALGHGSVVLFVGRMIEQKGPHLALRAFARICRSHPTARLVFVGAPWYSRANEAPFVQRVRAEAVAVADQIRFTGYVDHGRMPTYYALADVVCVPSIWDDPSPFVAYESQAMGKPVVASTRGGLPEIVLDRVTGRCIDVHDSDLFGRILGDWLGDSGAAKEMGRRGRARVCARFELRHAVAKILRSYEEVLAAS